jgi:hypothetical protein
MSQISTSYIYYNNNIYFQNLINYRTEILLDSLNSLSFYNPFFEKLINTLIYDIKLNMNLLLNEFLREHDIDLVESYNYKKWLNNKENKLYNLFEKLNKIINNLKLNLLTEDEEEIYNYFQNLSNKEKIRFSKTLEELKKMIKIKKINNFKSSIVNKIDRLKNLLEDLENFSNIFENVNLLNNLILAIKKDFDKNISKFLNLNFDIEKIDINSLENYILSLTYDFNSFYLDFNNFFYEINNWFNNLKNNNIKSSNLQELEILKFFNILLLNFSKYSFDNLLKILNTISEKIYKQDIDNYFKKIIETEDQVNKDKKRNTQVKDSELKNETTLKQSNFDKIYQKINNDFIYLSKILGIFQKLENLKSSRIFSFDIFSFNKVFTSEINNNILQLKTDIANLENEITNLENNLINKFKNKGITNLFEIKDLLYTLLQKLKNKEYNNLKDLEFYLGFIINNDINLQIIYDNLNVNYLKLKKQLNYFYYKIELNSIENNLAKIISDLSNLESYRYNEILNKIKNFLNEVSNLKNYQKIDENIYQDIKYRYHLILDEIEKIKQKKKQEDEIFEKIIKEIENQGYKFLITTEYGVVYLDTPLGFEYKIMLKFYEGKLNMKFIKIINDNYIVNNSERDRDIEIVKDWCKNYDKIIDLLKENNIFIEHEKLIEPTKENIDLIYIPVSKLPQEVRNVYTNQIQNQIQSKKQSYQKNKKQLKSNEI